MAIESCLRLDEELERAYKAALSVKEIQLDVRQSQRVWIEKDRNWCDRV